jgi:hypothetical protein
MITRFVLNVFYSAQYAKVATHESASVLNDLNYCLAMQDFADQKVQEGSLPEGEKEKFKVLHLFCA